ncbi:uncharacterized protein LOC127809365 [Diospyros lotus]|uniref:uncharacterized protein LOC127809365 n=1 Tax=Diospyros lotus TaxID=55363 RepID=UPI00225AC201|nr:uncharacterized protein LOC127809365 [Diospyros lotus]
MPFRSFMPFTEPRAAVLSSIAHTGLINFPPHTNQPMGRNMDFFCKFHESPGHTTEQCRELRNQIKQLIREGKLDRFILDKPKNQQGRREESKRNNQGRSTRPRGDAPNRRENQPPQQREGERNNPRKEEERPSVEDGNEPVMERIHVISGGENLVGDSSSSRKAYAHQALHVNSVEKIQEDDDPLIFAPEDRGSVSLPHDNPLVIYAIIANHPIERILVDNGSSVNLLYWNCFEKMHVAHD